MLEHHSQQEMYRQREFQRGRRIISVRVSVAAKRPFLVLAKTLRDLEDDPRAPVSRLIKFAASLDVPPREPTRRCKRTPFDDEHPETKSQRRIRRERERGRVSVTFWIPGAAEQAMRTVAAAVLSGDDTVIGRAYRAILAPARRYRIGERLV